MLLAETMENLESAAFSLLVPAGSAFDPADRVGLSALTCEMALRGAGQRDSRTFIEDLENLGVQRGESVSTVHTSYSGATLAKNLAAALTIYADLLRPALSGRPVEAGRMTAIQELRAIEDEPGHKVMLEPAPPPLSRLAGPSEGDMASLEAATIEEIPRPIRPALSSQRHDHRGPGQVDWANGWSIWSAACLAIGNKWRIRPSRPVRLAFAWFISITTGIKHTSASPTTACPIAIQIIFRRPAQGVLSGGMSSRLFSEAREQKRGLCYTACVHGLYHTLRDRACVMCYAGTTKLRAQEETLDVTLGESCRWPPACSRKRIGPAKGPREKLAGDATRIEFRPQRLPSPAIGITLGRVRDARRDRCVGRCALVRIDQHVFMAHPPQVISRSSRSGRNR